MAGWRTGSATTRRGSLGRVSFNPVRHVDPFGTLVLPGHPGAARLALRVRLGQAGAGGVPSPAQPQARHDLGGVGRAGHQHRAGARLPALLLHLFGQLTTRTRSSLDVGEPEERDLRQRRARLLQHAADPAARRRPGADRAAAAATRLAVRRDRALRPPDRPGLGVHRADGRARARLRLQPARVGADGP